MKIKALFLQANKNVHGPLKFWAADLVCSVAQNFAVHRWRMPISSLLFIAASTFFFNDLWTHKLTHWLAYLDMQTHKNTYTWAHTNYVIQEIQTPTSSHLPWPVVGEGWEIGLKKKSSQNLLNFFFSLLSEVFIFRWLKHFFFTTSFNFQFGTQITKTKVFIVFSSRKKAVSKWNLSLIKLVCSEGCTFPHKQAAAQYKCPLMSFSVAAQGLTGLLKGFHTWQFHLRCSCVTWLKFM